MLRGGEEKIQTEATFLGAIQQGKEGLLILSPDDFIDHPKVINGASDLMVEVFGDLGTHSRAAVGCSSLPLGVAVEVEGIFQIN